MASSSVVISPLRVPRRAAMRPPLSSTTSRLSTVPSRSVSVQHDIVADELVAFGRQHDDVADRADFAGLAVPHDLVGGEVIAFAVHADRAARGHDVGLAVVGDRVGAEFDDLVGRRCDRLSRWSWRRRFRRLRRRDARHHGKHRER